jgi:6,7-dimethyl-8-ribityllumazine synthase
MNEEHIRLDGSGLRFGLVVARFNALVTEPLLEGARAFLLQHGVEAIEVVRVPGGWELPLAVRWMADSGRYDGLVALGCVIRGGTPHFEYVSGEMAKGLSAAQNDHRIPVGFGVLTTDTLEQALERAGSKMGNKGWEAAAASLEMALLRRRLGS